MNELERMMNDLVEQRKLLRGEVTRSEVDGLPVLTLNAGPYAGVTYAYGGMGFDEDEEQFKIRFDYKIVDPGPFKRRQLERDDRFKNHIGDLLCYLFLCHAGAVKDSEWANFSLETA